MGKVLIPLATRFRVLPFIAMGGILALLLTACQDLAQNDGERQVLQWWRSGQYELIKKEELNQLKREAETQRSVGRYQLYTRAYRTWRLDTATGQNCLLLTSEADWKTADAKLAACPEYQ